MSYEGTKGEGTDARPAVSIITPVLNGIKYIEPCIRSVLSQTYANTEHVFVDGGSTDGTSQLLVRYQKQFPKRITVEIAVETSPGGGPGRAWNRGFEIARGNILGWLGADDMLCDDQVIQTVVDFFQRNPNAVFVHGACNYIDETGQLLFVHKTRDFTLNELVNNGNFIACPSAFYRSDVISVIGGIDDYGNDFEFFIRVAKHYPINRIERPLSNFRVHCESETGNHKKLERVVYLDYLASRKHGGKYFSHFAFRYYQYKLLSLLNLGSSYYVLRGWWRSLLNAWRRITGN